MFDKVKTTADSFLDRIRKMRHQGTEIPMTKNPCEYSASPSDPSPDGSKTDDSATTMPDSAGLASSVAESGGALAVTEVIPKSEEADQEAASSKDDTTIADVPSDGSGEGAVLSSESPQESGVSTFGEALQDKNPGTSPSVNTSTVFRPAPDKFRLGISALKMAGSFSSYHFTAADYIAAFILDKGSTEWTISPYSALGHGLSVWTGEGQCRLAVRFCNQFDTSCLHSPDPVDSLEFVFLADPSRNAREEVISVLTNPSPNDRVEMNEIRRENKYERPKAASVSITGLLFPCSQGHLTPSNLGGLREKLQGKLAMLSLFAVDSQNPGLSLRLSGKYSDAVSRLADRLPCVLLSDVLRPALYSAATGKTLSEGTERLMDNILEVLEYVSQDGGGGLSFEQKPEQKALANATPGTVDAAGDRLTSIMYGENMEFLSYQKLTDKDGKRRDRLRLRVRNHATSCPFCGCEGCEAAKGSGGIGERKFQDVPITPTVPLEVVIMGGRKMACTNPECAVYGRVFNERFPCVLEHQRRSVRLNALILSFVPMLSFHGCMEQLSLFGVEISDDAIRDELMKIEFPDEPDIAAVGIDDVSKRKGISYYTVIYSLEDHRLLSIVDGRDGANLEKWLDDHPKVRMIARDRGSAYSDTISRWAERHGVRVTEIADRFHLIDNCIKHLKEQCYGYLPLRVALSKGGGQILDVIPNKVAVAAAPKPTDWQMAQMDYTNAPVLDAEGKRIEVVLGSARKPAEPGQGKASHEKPRKQKADVAQEKRDSKYRRVKEIHDAFDREKPAGPQYTCLAEKYGVSRQTVIKYCSMSTEELEAVKEPAHHKTTGPRHKMIDDYKNMIYRMFQDGRSVSDIFWYVKTKGYTQSDSQLINEIQDIFRFMYPDRLVFKVSRYIKLVYPEDIVVIGRCGLLRYFLTVNPDTKKDENIARYESQILEKYPDIAIIRDTFKEFHSAVMGSAIDAVDRFCDGCRIPELKGFCDSLRSDRESIQNAIRYTESSGLVEGNNNKFKLIKRVSYGRLKLNSLFKKCMFAFWYTLDGFRLSDLVPWLPEEDNAIA